MLYKIHKWLKCQIIDNFSYLIFELYFLTYEGKQDFIYLCRLINKHKYDDLFGEIMMLRYGYDYNSIKIAKLLQVRKKCVEKYLEQLIDFWRENKEYLGE